MITKIIKITLLIIWMIIIFMFSSQTGSESQYVSDTLINKTVCINNSCNFDLVSFLIRKLAHFTLYFIEKIYHIFLISILKIIQNKMYDFFIDIFK